MNTYNPNTPTKNDSEEGNRKEKGVGEQLFPPASLRSTRSTDKAAVNKTHGRSSRATPYEVPMDKRPRLCLKKIDVVNFKVESNGSTFKMSMGTNGEFLMKEREDPR